MRALALALGLGLALLGAACGGEDLRNLEVTNLPNAYTLAVDLEGVSGAREERWTVSGDRVWVRWEGTALSAGNVSLTLTSPEGAQLYRERALPGEVPKDAASQVASSGAWTVRLAWSDARGHLAIDLSGVR